MAERGKSSTGRPTGRLLLLCVLVAVLVCGSMAIIAALAPRASLALPLVWLPVLVAVMLVVALLVGQAIGQREARRLAKPADYSVTPERLERERDSARVEGEEAARVAVSEEAAGVKRRFLGRLERSLATPLTTMRAVAGEAIDSGSPDPAWVAMDAQARELGDLVADLRFLSELETATMQRERVDLADTVTQVLSTLGSGALAGELAHRDVRVSLAPDVIVIGDPDLLRLAVRHVVANAVRYSAVGGTVTLTSRKDADAVVLEVTDDGRGIPAEDLEAVLEDLARASNVAERHGARGLGLSFVKVITRRHGGELGLRSGEGRGTTVSLRLPVEGAGE